ncbi:major facilitator superfamily protein, putative [Ichthyophthirius multifiliis]|uniref:Major facilitator superfamily protein, putative n=1 Tax=Ichthyophthirius multifiliis TaxID=5932 RepID=G0R3L4_ICHMU|nr:major facilitator superfamily protein, putative [Ichthyophthirius multifiliis]EGR27936.1 major facilitator superfamily protein, putative [Ichthyophthirius multifiliis]|eukprot:XP_004027281.1 major facilitator superfamily protein, putative [Ichthyophthirius multifiliis]
MQSFEMDQEAISPNLVKLNKNIKIDTNQNVFFDNLLRKIGWGKFNTLSFIAISMSIFGDAIEILVGSMLFPAFEKKWGVKSDQQITYGTFIFLGFMLGPIFSGYFSDKIGRKKTIEISNIGQFMFGLISSFAPNFTIFTILRTIYSFLTAISLPTCFTYISEVTHVEMRGKAVGMISLSFGLGDKLLVQTGWCVVGAYSSETYKTDLRSFAIATSSIIGRFGGVIMPWICYQGFHIRVTGPFLLFALFSIISTFAAISIPFDTTGLELDLEFL